MIYSHKGKTLIEHISEIKKIILDNEGNLDELDRVIVSLHDLGKSTKFFKNKLLNSVVCPEANHSYISALFTFLYLRENGFSVQDCVVGYCVVFSHHSHIKSIEQMSKIIRNDTPEYDVLIKQINDMFNNAKDIEAQFKSVGLNINIKGFADELSRFDRRDRVSLTAEICKEIKRIDQEVLYKEIIKRASRLLKGDEFSASGINFERSKVKQITSKDILNHIYSFPVRNKLDTVRREILEDLISNVSATPDILDRNVLFLNVFTGGGKTLLSSYLATYIRELKQKATGANCSIIYSLPLINIIEQTFEILEDILKRMSPDFDDKKSAYLSACYYLAESIYFDKHNPLGMEELNKHKLLLDNFESDMIVTTFVQLFNVLFTNKNTNVARLSGLKNSIVIMDEVQMIAVKYWGIVENILTLWGKEMNIHFILMTATKPLLFKNTATVLLKAGFNRLPGHRVKLFYHNNSLSLPDLCDFYLGELESKKMQSSLICLNTISSSQEFMAEYVYNKIKKLNPDIECIYISNSITSYEKKQRIDRVKEILDRISKGSKERVLLISTQSIEAGVDVSFQYVIRDFAPLDAIIQICGRCVRNLEATNGEVHIVNLYGMANKYKYKYSEAVYDKDIELHVTSKILTKAFLSKDYLTDRDDFDGLIDEYFLGLEKYLSSHINYLRDKLWKGYIELNGEVMQDFRLIEETDKVNLFVELNDEAKEIYQKYLDEVVNEPDFRKKINNSLKLKRDLNKYTISIYRSKLEAEKLVISQYMDYITNCTKDKDGNPPELLRIPQSILYNVYNPTLCTIYDGTGVF
jgi:CRISPR-associated helicase Cas3